MRKKYFLQNKGTEWLFCKEKSYRISKIVQTNYEVLYTGYIAPEKIHRLNNWNSDTVSSLDNGSYLTLKKKLLRR